MLKPKYLFLLSHIFVVLITQAQVTVVLRQPPPYQLKVEDFWKVTLNNNTQNTYNVYLYGIATRTGEGKIVDANTSKFQLPPGTRIVQPKDISPINIIDKKKEYEGAISRTGMVPTGEYEICLIVYNADNGEILGEECISHSVEIINGLELLLPEDKTLVLSGPEDTESDYQKHDWNKEVKTGKAGLTDEEALEEIVDNKPIKPVDPIKPERINNVNGSFLTFSWIAPSPAPRGGSITYTITLTEILGRQSAYDAIKSNPAFYKANNLFSTIYQYPSISRNFVSGKRYAWQVTAYLNGIKMTESEINEFSYQDNKMEYRNRPIHSFRNLRPHLSQGIESNRELRLGKGTIGSLSLKKTSPIQFYGSINVEGLNSNRKGTGSELPERYANLTLTPSVSLYGIPFSSTILLSTLGQSNMQNINSFSLGFDPYTLKEMIQKRLEGELEKAKSKIEQEIQQQGDKLRKETQIKLLGFDLDTLKNPTINQQNEINKVKDKADFKVKENGSKYREKIEGDIKAKAMANLPRWMKIFTKINSLGIGTNYPNYTTNTLKGVPVSGLDLDFNPGLLYVAFSGLGSQKAIDNVSYKRNIYAGRLGIGNKDKSHFIMTLMHAFDDENSISVNDSNLTLTPKANWLFGLDGKVSLFKDKLSFEAEGVLSMLTRDVRDPDIISDAIPGWVKNMFKPKGSSSADYMYSGKLSYENVKSNTKVSAELKMIGAGFNTLGNPTLRNDKFGFEGKIDQKFLENRVSTSLIVKNYKDNLLQTKTATTTTTSVIFRLSLRFRGYPSLSITVMPNFQKNDKQITTTDSSKVDSKTISFTGISSYFLKLGDINTQTSIMFSYNDNKTLFGIYDYLTKTTQLTESFSFKFPLSVSTSIGMVQTMMGNFEYSRNITFALTGNFTIKSIWQNSAGLDISTDKEKSNRLGVFISSNILIAKMISLDVRAEQVNYTDKLFGINNYKDFVLRSTLMANW